SNWVLDVDREIPGFPSKFCRWPSSPSSPRGPLRGWPSRFSPTRYDRVHLNPIGCLMLSGKSPASLRFIAFGPLLSLFTTWNFCPESAHCILVAFLGRVGLGWMN